MQLKGYPPTLNTKEEEEAAVVDMEVSVKMPG